MKRIIPFIIAILIAIAAFFGLQHFSNKTVAETAKEEISLPELTIEPTSTQETVSELEVTSTATPAPTADPNLMYIMRDPESGKIYYQTTGSMELLLQRIKENITAEEAVDATECTNYGAMMTVHHDDERIIEGITAYDLISDEDALVVTFNRNGSKLFVCEEGETFKPSEATDKSFKGLADKKAYGAWICSEHQAFKASALLCEGYPESDGYRGPFAVSDGFSAKVLKSVVLVKTGEDRYDWCLVVCDCKDSQPTGGTKPTKPSKPSQPTQAPTTAPTQQPTQAPTQEPTQAPSHAPEATLPPKVTANPTHAPEATLPPKQESTVTRPPELGNPEHAQATSLPEKKSETTSESAHANEQKVPEKKTETISEVKSSELALPPKKGTVSVSSGEPAPALGGVTF